MRNGWKTRKDKFSKLSSRMLEGLRSQTAQAQNITHLCSKEVVAVSKTKDRSPRNLSRESTHSNQVNNSFRAAKRISLNLLNTMMMAKKLTQMYTHPRSASTHL
jgi:hypothetical protein